MNIVGLLPAGGRATRLGPLPLSKELFPIGFDHAAAGQPRPKVVGQYLLEAMRQAGITRAFWILRPGKWDIPAYFGDGAALDLRLAYLTVHVADGVPYTLDQAFPFVQDAIVALGFPDILFQPEDAYSPLLTRLSAGEADVVLGLFPTAEYWQAGMVEFDAANRVTQIIEKPPQSDLRYMWAIAVWRPRFTQFLHAYVGNRTAGAELPIGDVIQAAIVAGLRVEAELFATGQVRDVGTPENLRQAIRDLT